MFVINDDMSIYITRGDVAFFQLSALNEEGVPYKFQAGDVVRFKVFEKKACENVAFQKCFAVTEETETVEILLTEEETKIGEVISKPVDYWYEVELNPFTYPQTIIGYDDEGTKIFKLFPEGEDVEDTPITPEDIPLVDSELDLTSTRPIQNQAVARAHLLLEGKLIEAKKSYDEIFRGTKETLEATKKSLAELEEKWNETGVIYDLLWENPEPTTEFAGRVIELGTEIMEKYDFFCVTYKETSAASYDMNYILLKNRHAYDNNYVTGVPGAYYNEEMLTFSVIADNFLSPIKRPVMTTLDKTGINIMDGRYMNVNGAATKWNNHLIPCKIYGVKNKIIVDNIPKIVGVETKVYDDGEGHVWLNHELREENEFTELHQSKADAITCESSGNEIILTDSAESGFEQFRIYGKSTQGENPAPDNPQPIVSAGQKLAEGNQLINLDANWLPTSNSVMESDAVYSCVIPIKGNSYIYISGDLTLVNSGVVRIGLFNEYPAVGKTVSKYIEMANGAVDVSGYSYAVLTFSISGMNSTKEQIERSFMANYGSTPLPWEPYTGGVKKACDVGISKKLTGKNLLDLSNVLVYSATAKRLVVDLPAGTYTFSCQNTNSKSVRIYYADESYTEVISWTKNTSCTFTVEKAFCGVQVNVDTNQASSIDFLEWCCQLEKGTVTTDYEPYTEQTLAINRVLNGIPLGQTIPDAIKSSPAHMDGVYWDDETQQYYIGDTEDGVNGVYVQRVGEFNATLDGVANALTNTHELRCAQPTDIYRTSDNYLIAQHAIRVQEIITGTTTTWNYDTNGIMAFAGNTAIAIRTPLNITSLETVIQYILANPIEIPLADEEIEAYKVLHTNKPTTIITNDAGCFMEVEYVADTYTYIEKSVDALCDSVLRKAKDSGEFDGKDGADGKDGVSVTHSWNGTVLTITSASGTSSADLKGEKGNPGEGGSGGESVQADWNQNDASASDYVKNRTHYKSVVTEDIIEETTITGEWNDLFETDDASPPEKIIVIFDGTKYDLLRFHTDDGTVSWGDSRLYNSDANNPMDVPFLIVWFSNSDGLGFGPETYLWSICLNSEIANTSHTIKIEVETDEVTYHTLDERFIPDTIARKKELTEHKHTWDDFTEYKNVTLLEETTLIASEEANGMGMIFSVLDVEYLVSAIVTYNGQAYECTVQPFDLDGMTGYVMGDSSLLGIGDSTGEPFCVGLFDSTTAESMNGVGGLVMPLDGSTQFTIAISGKEFIQPIPEKYIKLTEKSLPKSVKTYYWDTTATELMNMVNGNILEIIIENLDERDAIAMNLYYGAEFYLRLDYNGAVKVIRPNSISFDYTNSAVYLEFIFQGGGQGSARISDLSWQPPQ